MSHRIALCQSFGSQHSAWHQQRSNSWCMCSPHDGRSHSVEGSFLHRKLLDCLLEFTFREWHCRHGRQRHRSKSVISKEVLEVVLQFM